MRYPSWIYYAVVNSHTQTKVEDLHVQIHVDFASLWSRPLERTDTQALFGHTPDVKNYSAFPQGGIISIGSLRYRIIAL